LEYITVFDWLLSNRISCTHNNADTWKKLFKRKICNQTDQCM
jgi:hypothetical protein